MKCCEYLLASVFIVHFGIYLCDLNEQHFLVVCVKLHGVHVAEHVPVDQVADQPDQSRGLFR